LYQDEGVAEYWIVDVELRQVEVWRPGAMEAEVRTDAVRWPEPGIEGLTIELEKIFRAV
jgi:Uma2 family endonuclease